VREPGATHKEDWSTAKLFKGLHLEFCNKESRAPFVMEKQCQFMKIFEHKVPKN
jgi:hypothetical protein